MSEDEKLRGNWVLNTTYYSGGGVIVVLGV